MWSRGRQRRRDEIDARPTQYHTILMIRCLSGVKKLHYKRNTTMSRDAGGLINGPRSYKFSSLDNNGAFRPGCGFLNGDILRGLHSAKDWIERSLTRVGEDRRVWNTGDFEHVEHLLGGVRCYIAEKTHATPQVEDTALCHCRSTSKQPAMRWLTPRTRTPAPSRSLQGPPGPSHTACTHTHTHQNKK